MKRHAFTLIELLVVIAIIIALLAILMPSMSRALFVSQETVCASNFRQKAVAVADNAGDNFGQYYAAPINGGIGLNPWGYDDGFLPMLAQHGVGWQLWFCPLVPDFWTHNTAYNVPASVTGTNDNTAVADYMLASGVPSIGLVNGHFNYYVPRQTSGGSVPHNGVGSTRDVNATDEWPSRMSEPGTKNRPLMSDIAYTFPSDPKFKEAAHGGHAMGDSVESLNAVWPDGSVQRRTFGEFELRQDHHYGVFF